MSIPGKLFHVLSYCIFYAYLENFVTSRKQKRNLPLRQSRGSHFNMMIMHFLGGVRITSNL